LCPQADICHRPLVPRKEAQMEGFVHRQNLEHYRKLLAETTDEAQRRMLLKLIAEEDAKEPSRRKAGSLSQV
jgi:hypothetical protein